MAIFSVPLLANSEEVLVDAHYDVVPVEPVTENDWDFEPFSGEVRGGYVMRK